MMTSRILRCGSPIIAGLALGLAIHDARAADTASSLLANPKRLDEVQRGCKMNAPWATEALCKEAAQATRRRFRGEGIPYTPHRVDPFPSHPEMKPAPAPPGTPEASRTRRQYAAARPQ